MATVDGRLNGFMYPVTLLFTDTEIAESKFCFQDEVNGFIIIKDVFELSDYF